MTQHDFWRIRTFEHRFLVPTWNETTHQQAIEFWKELRIRLQEGETGTLIGKRGSIAGYFLSSDIRQFPTTLALSVFFAATPFTGDEIRCVLTVKTTHQAITGESEIWWPVELKTFEGCLLEENDHRGQWKRIVKKRWKILAGTTPELRRLRTRLRSNKDDPCPPLLKQ